MRAIRTCLFALSLSFAFAAALGVAGARAADDDSSQPAGTVVEPDTVTSAPTDEDASAKAGGGFDPPADAVPDPNASGDEPQPKGTTADPNN